MRASVGILEHSFSPSVLGTLEDRPSSTETAIWVRVKQAETINKAKARGQPRVDEWGGQGGHSGRKMTASHCTLS